MTEAQKEAFWVIIDDRLMRFPVEFHHGDCLGADAEAHEIFERRAYFFGTNSRIVIHPPHNSKFRAFCDKKPHGIPVTVLMEEDYHKRNGEIIRISDEVIACPDTFEEQLKGSGTWSVIRRSRKAGRKLTVIYPDGTGVK